MDSRTVSHAVHGVRKKHTINSSYQTYFTSTYIYCVACQNPDRKFIVELVAWKSCLGKSPRESTLVWCGSLSSSTARVSSALEAGKLLNDPPREVSL